MDNIKLYKCLNKGRQPKNGGSGRYHHCAWMPKIENIKPCVRGYHLCRAEDILKWLGEEIWEAKGRGNYVVEQDKVVFEEVRLVRKLDWNMTKMVHFGADCAAQVLHLYEKRYPKDLRVRKAIEVAKQYPKTADAARYAVRNAAYAARNAAYAAAAYAAYAADAAYAAYAAYAADAVRNAAYAARDAALDPVKLLLSDKYLGILD